MIKKKISQYLSSRSIDLPVDEFITEVSNIYHKYESEIYDSQHQSLFDSSKLLKATLDELGPELPDDITVLDYGCGTGFCSIQLLNSSLIKKVTRLICFDLSPEMITVCQKNIDTLVDNSQLEVIYLSNVEGYKQLSNYKYDLIMTNAVLHHLYDLKSFFDLVKNTLKQNGIYISGHEPNTRFYSNNVLIKITKYFQIYKKLMKLFSIKYWKLKFKLIENRGDIELLTNKMLLKKGLIREFLPNGIIPKLVDIHVPIGLSKDQLWGELGFSAENILSKYLSGFKLLKQISYSHIKDNTAENYWLWRKINSSLKNKFPEDGADCLLVFKHTD